MELELLNSILNLRPIHVCINVNMLILFNCQNSYEKLVSNKPQKLSPFKWDMVHKNLIIEYFFTTEISFLIIFATTQKTIMVKTRDQFLIIYLKYNFKYLIFKLSLT